jgi:hypothetical protein
LAFPYKVIVLIQRITAFKKNNSLYRLAFQEYFLIFKNKTCLSRIILVFLLSSSIIFQNNINKMRTKVGKIIIGDNVVIPYPPNEIDKLKEVISNSGVLDDILKKFGIAKNTVTTIAKDGKGRKRNVEVIKAYVEAYMKHAVC